MADEHPPGSAPAVTPAARPSANVAPQPASSRGDLTTLLCERCGNANLVRVKGCWYCEKCHYKFDCFGY